MIVCYSMQDSTLAVTVQGRDFEIVAGRSVQTLAHS